MRLASRDILPKLGFEKTTSIDQKSHPRLATLATERRMRDTCMGRVCVPVGQRFGWPCACNELSS